MAVTLQQLMQWKEAGRSIISLTAWDYSLAQVLDRAGVDIILVGDSLAMVALGHDSTLPVTLEQMIHHAQAVCRGVKRALVVCDLPFMSYQVSVEEAIHSAGKVIKETGASAIKLEGGHPKIIEIVRELTTIGIPVMGHVGLTPQSFRILGYKQQGKSETEAGTIFQQANRSSGGGSIWHYPRAYS